MSTKVPQTPEPASKARPSATGERRPERTRAPARSTVVERLTPEQRLARAQRLGHRVSAAAIADRVQRTALPVTTGYQSLPSEEGKLRFRRIRQMVEISAMTEEQLDEADRMVGEDQPAIKLEIMQRRLALARAELMQIYRGLARQVAAATRNPWAPGSAPYNVKVPSGSGRTRRKNTECGECTGNAYDQAIELDVDPANLRQVAFGADTHTALFIGFQDIGWVVDLWAGIVAPYDAYVAALLARMGEWRDAGYQIRVDGEWVSMDDFLADLGDNPTLEDIGG